MTAMTKTIAGRAALPSKLLSGELRVPANVIEQSNQPMAISGGAMIACACKELLMGKQSSSGLVESQCLTVSRARHLSAVTCEKMGLKIEMLEARQSLQDAVLSIHHACMLAMPQTGAFKMIENHKGAAFIQAAQVAQMFQGTK